MYYLKYFVYWLRAKALSRALRRLRSAVPQDQGQAIALRRVTRQVACMVRDDRYLLHSLRYRRSVGDI